MVAWSAFRFTPNTSVRGGAWRGGQGCACMVLAGKTNGHARVVRWRLTVRTSVEGSDEPDGNSDQPCYKAGPHGGNFSEANVLRQVRTTRNLGIQGRAEPRNPRPCVAAVAAASPPRRSRGVCVNILSVRSRHLLENHPTPPRLRPTPTPPPPTWRRVIFLFCRWSEVGESGRFRRGGSGASLPLGRSQLSP